MELRQIQLLVRTFLLGKQYRNVWENNCEKLDHSDDGAIKEPYTQFILNGQDGFEWDNGQDGFEWDRHFWQLI
ncbi:hypothetical protein QE152_g31064 [Popillia japonica]|uniref:Uncharacterized protein n=1 Tax=Popillia japonica TaxID=7064 RepID=A0AAW1JBW4_POPJA